MDRSSGYQLGETFICATCASGAVYFTCFVCKHGKIDGADCKNCNGIGFFVKTSPRLIKVEENDSKSDSGSGSGKNGQYPDNARITY